MGDPRARKRDASIEDNSGHKTLETVYVRLRALTRNRECMYI